jgi:hypothetical protein
MKRSKLLSAQQRRMKRARSGVEHRVKRRRELEDCLSELERKFGLRLTRQKRPA